MSFVIPVIILAIVQGLAELLPVSSSAHVIVAEKFMGMDPGSSENMLLLVMLHTGTMLAVIVYFWKGWKQTFFSSRQASWRYAKMLVLATALTGVVFLAIKMALDKLVLHGERIETLARNLPLIASALACAGVLIVYAGLRRAKTSGHDPSFIQSVDISAKQSASVGLIQGLCIPFRGFSRSGATISVGLLASVPRRLAEEFSFALAVILTPAAIAMELHNLVKDHPELRSAGLGSIAHLLLPGMLGLVFSFLAGLVALRWLSRWLEKGRWHYFGYYCLVAAAAVLVLHFGWGY